jgi:hypothetical protein
MSSFSTPTGVYTNYARSKHSLIGSAARIPRPADLMKTVQLTKGFVTLVSDEDYERVSAHKWHAFVDRKRGKVYARRTTHRPHHTRKSEMMHRAILAVTDPKVKVDHQNGNGLDSQRENIRACTTSQNNMNQQKRKGDLSSRYKGVCWNKRFGKFQAVPAQNQNSAQAELERGTRLRTI